ncbi:hypothetical protein BJ742DRAFT_742678 [Cladochytrium replicatum]|nr:hypothetical protein BJ742DRAFT_742678 [Cladochytrium replicatum]
MKFSFAVASSAVAHPAFNRRGDGVEGAKHGRSCGFNSRGRTMQCATQLADSVLVLFSLSKINRVENKDWFRLVDSENFQTEMKTFRDVPDDYKGLLGYATFPSDYKQYPKDDGVIVNFGSLPNGYVKNYNLGKTLTSETGHWLGWFHTFQDNGDGNGCLWPCVHPITNFMDFADDRCMLEFTKGQGELIRAQSNLYRDADSTTPTSTTPASSNTTTTSSGGRGSYAGGRSDRDSSGGAGGRGRSDGVASSTCNDGGSNSSHGRSGSGGTNSGDGRRDCEGGYATFTPNFEGGLSTPVGGDYPTGNVEGGVSTPVPLPMSAMSGRTILNLMMVRRCGIPTPATTGQSEVQYLYSAALPSALLSVDSVFFASVVALVLV